MLTPKDKDRFFAVEKRILLSSQWISRLAEKPDEPLDGLEAREDVLNQYAPFLSFCSGLRLERSSKRLEFLTWVLIVLSVVLALLAVPPFVKEFPALVEMVRSWFR